MFSELRGPIVIFHKRLTTLSQNRRELLGALSGKLTSSILAAPLRLKGLAFVALTRATPLPSSHRSWLRSLPCRADHRDKVNRAIHLACIWPILWTTLALMTQLPIGKLPHEVLKWLPLRDEAWDLHLGTPIVLIFVIVYCGESPCREDNDYYIIYCSHLDKWVSMCALLVGEKLCRPLNGEVPLRLIPWNTRAWW